MAPTCKMYQDIRVIQEFREIFNCNLTMIALKGKKLHPDDIQEIRGFTMTYKGLATFTMTYKKLTLKYKLIDFISLSVSPFS
jgi:hypothetical protein